MQGYYIRRHCARKRGLFEESCDDANSSVVVIDLIVLKSNVMSWSKLESPGHRGISQPA